MELFIDDRVEIPEFIKKMSDEELREVIEELEKESKNKNVTNKQS